MIIFIALFILISLVGVQLTPTQGKNYIADYMSVDKTMAIKGIFIIIVFFSHFNSYVTFTSAYDIAYLEDFSRIGQRMVAMFMFYSGYGVMESIKRKNMSYIKKIPVSRVLGTLFRFDIAILLFLAVDIILNREFTLPQLLLSFIGWDSIGNSNWYIFAILVAYTITYIAFMICRDKGKYYPAAILVTLGAVAYIFVLGYFKLKNQYWFDTMIIYPCGIWYSLLRDKIEKIINKNDAVWLFTFIFTVAAAYITRQYRSINYGVETISMMLFTAAIVLFTMRVSLNNRVLRWCGKNLFGLYILQRIPMLIFRDMGLAEYNIYLYFVVCFVVTVLMAWLFEKYVGKLWKLIVSPKKSESKIA